MAQVSDHRRRLAFAAGKKAGHAGKPSTANNRPEFTIYADDWWDGWNEAQNEKMAADDGKGED